MVIQTNKTQHEVVGLMSCVTYVVVITPIDFDNNEGGNSVIPNAATAHSGNFLILDTWFQSNNLPFLQLFLFLNYSVTDPPVTNEPPSGTINSITIYWQLKLNKMNNCTLTSIKTGCYYVETKGHGYDPLNGQSTDYLEESPNDKLSLSANVTVRNLSPYTIYSCKATVVNSGGNSQWSSNLTFTTLEDSKFL